MVLMPKPVEDDPYSLGRGQNCLYLRDTTTPTTELPLNTVRGYVRHKSKPTFWLSFLIRHRHLAPGVGTPFESTPSACRSLYNRNTLGL